ncbi:DUF1642 domain-containing protein [Enterococcus faecium]|uniref:DUF1642 domain-containing protein n=1 Tax=Enterococcus faecium TaxID=1352 RepID=UPI001C9B92CD|nr:DUF1642 domain-containing protein [Enterococcus faecium]MBY7575623.1 DUF1642 domain-containing protein [Enterococcus faecium]UNS62352.1 DUF1642 domain-containing protein [Enterococcus faecium]
MNKQELIDKWESKTGAPAYEISDFSINPSKNEMYIAGYGVARTEIIKDLKQLDEPQKPVVPQFVAEWIEYAKKKGDSLAISFKPWNLYGVEYSKADRWIEDNQETFARAWIDGYEVEKEPLYEVIIGDLYLIKKFNNRNDFCFDTSCSLCAWEKSAYQLTEAEIKSIDERYWPFAVPVVEVVEG